MQSSCKFILTRIQFTDNNDILMVQERKIRSLKCVKGIYFHWAFAYFVNEKRYQFNSILFIVCYDYKMVLLDLPTYKILNLLCTQKKKVFRT